MSRLGTFSSGRRHNGIYSYFLDPGDLPTVISASSLSHALPNEKNLEFRFASIGICSFAAEMFLAAEKRVFLRVIFCHMI